MMYQPLNAKVESPNYEFNFATLEDFFPEKKITDLETKYNKPELLSKPKNFNTVRFKVTHERYQFSVLVQEKDGIINDFFARLPSYFLHDVFLQSLVTRLGKQKTYRRTGEEAFYIWSDEKFKYVYSAACTVTCFPIFFSVEPVTSKDLSLLTQMKQSALGK
jgi:hypothetical protein